MSSEKRVSGAIKDLCDVLRDSGISSATQYIPEISWMLSLKFISDSGMNHLLNGKTWGFWNKIYRQNNEEGIIEYINNDLLPKLSTSSMTIGSGGNKISDIFHSSRTKIKSDEDFNMLVRIIEKNTENNIFSLNNNIISKMYENLLLKLGEKGADSGQFFTPRPVADFMASIVDYRASSKICDPCCGTGGLLISASNSGVAPA